MESRRVYIVTSIVDLNELPHVPKNIDLVEVRADIIGDLALNSFQKEKSKVFVLKSESEGGTFKGNQQDQLPCVD